MIATVIPIAFALVAAAFALSVWRLLRGPERARTASWRWIPCM
jgi:multisubunit Na+/H+ antiporter MnhF subunit